MEARFEVRVIVSTGKEETDDEVSSETVKVRVDIVGAEVGSEAKVKPESEEAFQRGFERIYRG